MLEYIDMYIVGPGRPCDGTGEANDGVNLGAGLEVYKGKDDVHLQLRTLDFSANFDANQDASEINVDLSATGVAAGTYNNANVTVDIYGRVLDIEAGAAANVFVAYEVSEAESGTTSSSWQQKLRATFTAVSGTRYRIDFQYAMKTSPDYDIDGQVTINDTTVINTAHFKNTAIASPLWNDNTSGFYVSNTLDGTINVDIDYKVGYAPGGDQVYIGQARILVTKVP
jgi:hypothetical protein